MSSHLVNPFASYMELAGISSVNPIREYGV